MWVRLHLNVHMQRAHKHMCRLQEAYYTITIPLSPQSQPIYQSTMCNRGIDKSHNMQYKDNLIWYINHFNYHWQFYWLGLLASIKSSQLTFKYTYEDKILNRFFYFFVQEQKE